MAKLISGQSGKQLQAHQRAKNESWRAAQDRRISLPSEPMNKLLGCQQIIEIQTVVVRRDRVATAASCRRYLSILQLKNFEKRS